MIPRLLFNTLWMVVGAALVITLAYGASLAQEAEPLPGDADGCCGPTDECEVCR